MRYDPETHKYYDDAGNIVPSVTEIMAPLRDFSRIPAHVLQRAASWGTSLHTMVQFYLEDRLDESSLCDRQKKCLIHFKEWAKDFDLSQVICEMPMVSKLGFGGTPDMILPDMIVDLKSRAWKDYDDVQLAGYDILTQEYVPGARKHFILSLFDHGTKFVPCKDVQAEGKFMQLLERIKKWEK